MSNLGNVSGAALLPSITGDPKKDRLIRSGLLVVSGGMTAWIVAWLKARGYSDPNIDLLVSGAVFSALVAAATIVWGWISGKNTEAAAVQVLRDGVAAGIAHAEDASVPTVPPAAVSPKVAEDIVAAYAPKA